jgi:hypothetical protein
MKFTIPRILPRIERRYVYVLNVRPASGLIPFLWVAKVGFSVDADLRAADVERSIWQRTGQNVRVSTFFRVRVFMFRGTEKAVHTALRPYNTLKFSGANGGTEFFRVINLVLGLMCYLFFWAYGLPCAGWLALCVMLLPWPLDFALFVLLLAVVEWALIGAAVYVGYLLTITFIGL